MSSKILLSEVCLLAKLKVIGIGKYTMSVGECGKGRVDVDNYEHSVI